MATKREDIDAKDMWNLASLYETTDLWEEEFSKLWQEAEKGWEKLANQKNSLKDNALSVKKLLDAYFGYLRLIEKVYTYAHLKHDENVADDMGKSAYQRGLSLIHLFQNAASWIEPSLLQFSEESLKALKENPEIREYRFYMQKLIDQKEHILSQDKEELLALSMRMQHTARSAFGALNNADIQFEDVEDSEGKKHRLTHGSYHVLMKSGDRTLRKNAFKSLHGSFQKFENTFAELIQGQVQGHIFNAKVRGYNSCLEAALKPNQIPLDVYHNLIKTVRQNLPTLHSYVALRKEMLGVDEFHFYDLQVSMVKDCDMRFSYEEGCKIVGDSVSLLGKEYTDILRKGITEDRWVDIYETRGKRTGAYSSGCYDSLPFILMNYQGTLSDVLTLAHEAGHSMNSLLSNRKQKYHEADYTIFVAEVASTFNEQLTYEYLLEKAKTKTEKLYILNHQIDALRNTFFRQAMFAEFELKIHELGEKQVPLTPALLKDEYLKLNKDYFGPELVVDEELAIEFARVPHFYYNFYVYQYATGIAAAAALVEKVKKEGPEKYLEFLAAGGSDYPTQVLKEAGVDMCKSDPIQEAANVFKKLIDKFKEEKRD